MMIISVRVTPKSRKERFQETREGEFAAAIREKPQNNEANDRVQRLVAGHYNVPLTNVRFLKGQRSRKKVFEVVQ